MACFEGISSCLLSLRAHATRCLGERKPRRKSLDVGYPTNFKHLTRGTPCMTEEQHTLILEHRPTTTHSRSASHSSNSSDPAPPAVQAPLEAARVSTTPPVSTQHPNDSGTAPSHDDPPEPASLEKEHASGTAAPEAHDDTKEHGEA